MTYPATYRNTMNGTTLKTVLEDVADNLFNTDPYYQQGGDMVRVGGLGFTIDPTRSIGSRISDMTILESGKPVEAGRDYVVAGWASIGENTQGPPIWDVVESYLAKNPVFRLKENRSVQLRGVK
jgi:S-sulfosulfanyl-L-cysteine sulfohydrolase